MRYTGTHTHHEFKGGELFRTTLLHDNYGRGKKSSKQATRRHHDRARFGLLPQL
jgi:hypothetical protein